MVAVENLKLEQERWRNNEDNWYLAFLYFNRKDKRILVTKRDKMLGMTLNFANLGVYAILAILIAVVVIL